MSISGSSFDWRGFWSDFLGSAGRGLLELDGSPAAGVALNALDHFATAQRRRRDEELALRRALAHAERVPIPRQRGDEGGLDSSAADEDGRDPDAAQYDAARARDELGGAEIPGRDLFVAMPGLSPSLRPAPLSADPYDHAGLPIRLQLGPRSLYRRR